MKLVSNKIKKYYRIETLKNTQKLLKRRYLKNIESLNFLKMRKR